MDTTQAQYSPFVIRTAAALTTSYVAGTIIGIDTAPNLNESIFIYGTLQLLVALTLTGTNASIKIEFSDDGTTWFQETVDSIGTPSTGTVVSTECLNTRTFVVSGNYRISIPIRNKFIRVSSIGVGTVAGSSFAVTAILGN